MLGHDRDREVLAAMVSHGGDLTKPAHTVHYLYFKSLAAASSAADELRAAGSQDLRVHRAPTTTDRTPRRRTEATA